MNNGTISAGPVKDSSVVFQTSQSVELRGVILKMTRLAVVFELYNPAAVLRNHISMFGNGITKTKP